jgi:hypothetical protein
MGLIASDMTAHRTSLILTTQEGPAVARTAHLRP